MLGIISNNIKKSIGRRTRGDIHKANRNKNFGYNRIFGKTERNKITKEELKVAGISFVLALGVR